jgi:DNA polymerase-3 subunit epsilon/ATP-dependent DNA helicase DinG
MTTYVAIDIETTGLDPVKDVILEVGAVRFNEHRVEDEFSSLVNPRRPIPDFITRLTGISDAMVMKAPELRDVMGQLAVFTEDAIVVGHNINFDLSFLRRNNILRENESLDTYELASVLLPDSTRYNLTFLAGYLGIPIGEMHRALNDAQITAQVFQKMVARVNELPVALLAEITRLAEPFDWQGKRPFASALRLKSRQAVPASALDEGRKSFFKPLAETTAPLQPNRELEPLDADEVAALLEHGGSFSKNFEQFEYRSQQVELLRSIVRAFNDGGHLLAEAATGIGKSFAYLVPAAMWAQKNNARVVISTNTINLQEQLISKDLPELARALNEELRFAVMKGRGNYLCPRRLEIARGRIPASVDELRVTAKVLVWLHGGGSGDRTEINLNGPSERDAWAKLSADDDACRQETCLKSHGGACPFYQAKQAAQSAHLLVVNHALLLADIATGNRVLPDYSYLIVDEGHHLEDATTNALSYKISQMDLERLLKEIGGSSAGILGRYLQLLRHGSTPSNFAEQGVLVRQATDYAFQVENQTRQFFLQIDDFLRDQREGRNVGTYSQQVRIISATRTQPDWSQVEIIWDDLHAALQLLLAVLNQIYQWVSENMKNPSDDMLDTHGSLGNAIGRLLEADSNLNGLVSKPDADRIYWVELTPNGRLSLQAAPLHIGPLMLKHMWNEKNSIIVTSATLAAAGDFSYIKGRLSAEEADEMAVGSPFDYENAAMLYLVNDVAEFTQGDRHQNEISSAITRLCKETQGRALVLFTSYAQLRKTSQVIGPALGAAGIQVYEQGEGASAATLLDNFKTTEKAVLLGTRSFWEGVDVPGEALSVVVIVKLPFDVPSDPIIAARSETFEDPFNEYQLPEAILKFRQGFGRLIRTQSDRGVVVVLDQRILTKKYGKLFIDSLPRCKMVVGSVVDLPKKAAAWLEKK